MSDWNALEEYVKDILSGDKAKRTPLSGGTKNEEDVVGRSFISQCKFTETKNISILAKDLDRLLNAAKLTDKFPLFASQSNAGTIISFPITEQTEEDIIFLLKALSCLNALRELNTLIPSLNSLSLLKKAQTMLRELKKEVKYIRDIFSDLINNIEQVIDAKYNDLTMCNLFEQE